MQERFLPRCIDLIQTQVSDGRFLAVKETFLPLPIFRPNPATPVKVQSAIELSPQNWLGRFLDAIVTS